MSRLPLFDSTTAVLQRYLPDLADQLGSVALDELESGGNPGIEMAKKAGATGLLIPPDFGGLGATAADAVAIQFALGRYAPSTAVALTMHHFTVATLVELVRETPAMEWIVLEAIATRGLLVASAFAEGHPDGKVLSPTMKLVADGPAFRLSGRKEPCSLTVSMDMITVSVQMPGDSEEFSVALIPTTGPGVRVEPMWDSPVLAGSETAAVVFDSVSVPRAALTYVGTSTDLDRVQVRGYVWFEVCITAAYLGVAGLLVRRVLLGGRADPRSVVGMVGELEAGLAMLDHVARRIDAGEGDEAVLNRALLVRYSVERSIQRATDIAFELLGVSALSANPALGALLAASRALSFHPPSRRRCEGRLAACALGAELVLE